MPRLSNYDLIDPWSDQLFVYFPEFLFSRSGNGIDLVPVNANVFRFHSEYFTQNEAARQIDRSFDRSSADIGSRIAELKKVDWITLSLFPIPVKAEPLPVETEPIPANPDTDP